ncbi:MAG: GNAT family N-acetyltransferase, partial [Streptosporangiaceae bacterium]
MTVACPALSGQDRLVIRGPSGSASSLVRAIVPLLSARYILFGEAGLISAVTTAVPGLEPRNQFGWMDAAGIKSRARSHVVRWLSPAEWPEVDDVLGRAFPDSYARPGLPGVRRWAGIREPGGMLAATAADAWSAPTLGFLAGVAVHGPARGQGLGRDVCHFVLADLLVTYGRASLMVHEWNAPAIRTYSCLGMSWGWCAQRGSAGHEQRPARPPEPVAQAWALSWSGSGATELPRTAASA